MGFDSTANIVNDAAVELGLWRADVTDPFASTDANAALLLRLLKSLGQRLVKLHAWGHLQKTHTFSTANGTASYSLPADYARTLAQTHWNRTSTRQLTPVGPQEWSELQARNVSLVTQTAFRIVGTSLELSPTPSAVETVAFGYLSAHWVGPSGATAPTMEASTAADDVLFFERQLLVAGLKLAWRREKGFDTTTQEQDFAEAFGFAVNAEGGAPVLSLSRPMGPLMLSWCNAPEGSWG